MSLLNYPLQKTVRQHQNFWNRYGKIVIGVAVAIVLLTAGYRGYKFYMKSQAETAGDAFMAAVQLSGQGKADEAIKALENIAATGSKAYAALAKMRLASEFTSKGDAAAAIKSSASCSTSPVVKPRAPVSS